MSIPADVLAQQVLQLGSADRAKPLGQVITSLDSDQAGDAKWNDLALQREAQADPAVLVRDGVVVHLE